MSAAVVIELLLSLGFEPDGETYRETLVVPTTRSPRYGIIGGEFAAFGGRLRYRLQGTDLRVTVGPRSVVIYRKIGKGAERIKSFGNLPTKEINDIREVLATAMKCLSLEESSHVKLHR